MSSVLLENLLRQLVKQYSDINDLETALFYSYELLSKNPIEEDREEHIRLLFLNSQFNECYQTFKRFYPHLDQYKLSPSFLYAIRSYKQQNKTEKAMLEIESFINNHKVDSLENDREKVLYSQLLYYLGEFHEKDSKSNAIQHYKQSLFVDPTNIRSSKKLLDLQSYSESKDYLSSLSNSNGNSDIISLQKKYCTYYLCQYHPFLIPYQQLQEISVDHLSPLLQVIVARCIRERGNLSSCTLILQQLLHQGHLSRELIIEYTILLYQRKMGDLLYAFIQSFPTSFSHRPEMSYMLGIYSLLKNDINSSLQHFNLALTKDRSLWEAWIGIGLARSFLEDHEMAITAFSFASQLCPQNYHIHLHAVNEYKRMGKPKDAQRELNECLKLDSSDPGLFNERGVLYYELQKYDDAENAFVQVLKLIDSFMITEKQEWVSVFYNLANVYRKQGKISQAQRLLQQVTIIGGPLAKTASYHLLAGLLYHKNRNIEEACVEYELAMACDPSNTQAKELFELATQQFSL